MVRVIHPPSTGARKSAPRSDKAQGPTPRELVRSLGGRWSLQLGIKLESDRPQELFKWLLAALLLGARISERLALQTWQTLTQAGLNSPRAILDAERDRLVNLLDRGGYARYDFKTADKLRAASEALQKQYGGDLRKLRDGADSEEALERALCALASGIGPVTASIFLRELRGSWPHAQPLPSQKVLLAARSLGYVSAGRADPAQALEQLQGLWRKSGGKAADFADFEAALMRYQLSAGKKARSPRASGSGRGRAQ
jgi:hypothetical protein